MNRYEVVICTPRGCYHMVITAGHQQDAEAQAHHIAAAQGGYVGNGGHARRL